MEVDKIFAILCLIAFSYGILYFYFTGRTALKCFPKLDLNKVKFRERNASGYSNKNWQSRIGGASNFLDVIIIESELWVKSPVLFAGIIHDLINRIRINQIQSLEKIGENVRIKFRNEENEMTEIVLTLKNPNKFIQILDQKD